MRTGIDAFDSLLGGGFLAGEMVEIFGEFGTGKTQLCHFFSVKHVVDALLGANLAGSDATHTSALYFDGEGSFRPERLAQISLNFGVKPEEVLKRVYCGRVDTFSGLIQAVKDLVRGDVPAAPGLVVMDGVTQAYREAAAESGGTGALLRRQLVALAETLSEYASRNGIPIVLASPVTSASGKYPPVRPVADFLLGYWFKERFFLKKEVYGGTERRCLSLVNSSHRPPGRLELVIHEGGIDAFPWQEWSHRV
ncbi:MAG: hypothetical protein Kow0069_18630 [Promethearchaeota archaeon]